MRTLITLGFLLVLVVASVPPAIAQEETPTFVIVAHNISVPFWVPVRKGAEDAGQLLGVEVQFTGPTDFNLPRQRDIIQAAIAAGVDGIGTTMPDQEAFDDLVDEALAAGIPIMAFNADDANNRMAYVGQNNVEAGRAMARKIIELLPDGGHVMLAIHTAGHLSLEERMSGVREVLDEAGNFTYDVVATTTDLVRATTLVASYYEGHTDTVGMFSVDDIGGSAIAQFIDQAERAGEIFCGGFDLVPEVMLAIQDGRCQFTIDQQPYLQGFQTVMQLYLYNKYKLSPTDVNTGIAAVEADTIEEVMALAEEGYR
ncbi:MAG: sugar ABC transporter substrate-binding protein [Anaerolineae bacterium]